MTILAFNRFYLPGYQAGGPIVSLANLFAALGGEIDFRMVTTDRDIADRVPYASIRAGQWTPVGNARVLYLPQAEASIRNLRRIAQEARPGTIYLNSFLDTRFTAPILLLRRLDALPQARLVLAPRGEFSAGALGLKRARKRAYVAALKAGGFLRDIEWHASTPIEAAEIQAAIGPRLTQRIHVAPDLGALPDAAAFAQWRPRAPGKKLRVCFLSRVSPKKNLDGALRAMGRMREPAVLTVYGPKEDDAYWTECRRAAADLPAHVDFQDGGALPRDAVHRTIARHDVFFLPTLGENYGHVIPEALSVGLPAVISDRTPWRRLAATGVGYDGPLDEEAFARELDRIAALNADALAAMRQRARDFARSALTDPAAVDANRRLFAG